MTPRALLLRGGDFPWLERPGLVQRAVVDFLASRSS
jgi:hypothetical protein